MKNYREQARDNADKYNERLTTTLEDVLDLIWHLSNHGEYELHININSGLEFIRKGLEEKGFNCEVSSHDHLLVWWGHL